MTANVLEATGDLNIICLMKFGSHLYGTNTPDSDTDYKGVFMPTREQVLTGKIPKSMRFDSNTSNEKNSKEDVDAEMYSLHYFIELACKGETAAMDMLHCNAENLVKGSAVWTELQDFRQLFYTKNLHSFVGYARKQAAKYGMKGSRLAAAEKFLKFLWPIEDPNTKLLEVWNDLPTGEHAVFLEDNHAGLKQYQLCGKILQSTISVGMAIQIMNGFVNSYGDRARKAKANEGVDWKAMSHAIRAAYQVREILEHGTITFPLKDAKYLTDVKLGKLDFTTNVLPELETAMLIVEDLSEDSHLPVKVNYDTWMTFLMDAVDESINPK